jgi:NAD(P)H-dependent FMN reductase
MTPSIKVLLLDGSPAVNSHTAALLRHLQGLLQEAGYDDAQLVSLRELNLPTNDPAYHTNPHDHPNQNVRNFVQQIEGAQVIVLGSPLYHGSFSGLIKSTLDHLVDDAFKGKAIGIVSNAAGVRVSIQAAQQLVLVARTMSGNVSDRLIGTNKTDYTDQAGIFVLTSEEILERSKVFIKELLKLA